MKMNKYTVYVNILIFLAFTTVGSAEMTSVLKPVKEIAIFQNYLFAYEHQLNKCPDPITKPEIWQELKAAFNWYLSQEKDEDPNNQYYIGAAYFYTLGTGTAPDIAEKWFIKSAAQGNVRAMYQLGIINFTGGVRIPQTQYINETQKAAIHWFEEAANKGDPQSQWMLSYLYTVGWGGIIKNTQIAYKWLQKAANQNDPVALTGLGDFYFSGTFVNQDYKKALSLYEKALKSTEIPYPSKKYLLNRLTYMYEKGLGTSKNIGKAKYFNHQLKMLLAERNCMR